MPMVESRRDGPGAEPRAEARSTSAYPRASPSSSAATHRSIGSRTIQTSAYVRVTYAYALTQQDSNLSQIVAMGVLRDQTSPFRPSAGLYQPDLQKRSIRYWLRKRIGGRGLGTFQCRVDKKLGDRTVSPNFYSWGRDDRPNHIEIDSRTSHVPGETSRTTAFLTVNEPRLISTTSRPESSPQMTTQLYDIRGLPAYGVASCRKPPAAKRKRRRKIDLRKDFADGFLELKFGAKYAAFAPRDLPVGRIPSSTGIVRLAAHLEQPVSRPSPGKYGWSVPDR